MTITIQVFDRLTIVLAIAVLVLAFLVTRRRR